MIQLNNGWYWLHAAVNPETNELRHTRSEYTTNTVLAQTFLAEIDEKHDVSEAVFLIDCSHSLQVACNRGSYDFRYEKHGSRNDVEHVFREIKLRTVLATLQQKTADNWSASLNFAWNHLM